CEDCEHACVVHLCTIAATGPFGKCRTAHGVRLLGLPVAPADEAEERKHDDDDQDDPEDAHVAPSVGSVANCRQEENGRAAFPVTSPGQTETGAASASGAGAWTPRKNTKAATAPRPAITQSAANAQWYPLVNAAGVK